MNNAYPNQYPQGAQGRPMQQAPTPIMQADQNYKRAGDAVKASLLALGQQYFDANKDNGNSEFFDQIETVKECMEKEKLWHQYRLGLEGKTQCESCGAIITSDSVFCNKCGGSIKPRDFSAIGITRVPQVAVPVAKNCPACGSPLVDGAAFCEKCGRKL